MGRLTLNVLLSFAQFEREVTGERIRDKIAASKQKGLWMGGPIPFGYYLQDRRLHPKQDEAKQLVAMYQHYAEHGSYLQLMDYCRQEGYSNRSRSDHVSASNETIQGKPFYRQQVHRLLTNPLYIGKVVHKGKWYEGQHEAIIDQALWEAVQVTMQTQDQKSRHRWQQPYLLKGLVQSSEGFCLSPSTLQKPIKTIEGTNKKRLIRYYTSQKAIQQGYKTCNLKSLNAQYVDDLIRSQIGTYLLHSKAPTASVDVRESINAYTNDTIRYLESSSQPEQDFEMRLLIKQVTISTQRVVVDLNAQCIETLNQRAAMLLSNTDHSDSAHKPITLLPLARYQATVIETNVDNVIRLVLAIQIKRQGQSRMILTPDGKDLVMPKQPIVDEGLVTAVCKGQHWQQLMLANRWSFQQLAEREQTDVKNAHGWVSLAYLAPTITQHVLQGRHLPSWTLKRLIQAARLPLWAEQYRFLGIEDQLSIGQTMTTISNAA